MPLYEYKCDDHPGLLELLRKAEDRDVCPSCPTCGRKMDRMASDTYFPPESLFTDSTIFPGMRVRVNDHDDPFEGTGIEEKIDRAPIKYEPKTLTFDGGA